MWSWVVVVMALRSVVSLRPYVPRRTLTTRRPRSSLQNEPPCGRPVDESGSSRLPKRKVALLMGYQGAKYYGMQRQTGDAVPTIESELERALSEAGLVSDANRGDLSKIGWTKAARTDKAVCLDRCSSNMGRRCRRRARS